MMTRSSPRPFLVALLTLSAVGCGGSGGGGEPTPLVTLTVQKSGSGSGTVTGSGIDCGATCSVSVAPGTVVALTSTPGAGSTFAGWSGCDSWTGTTCNITMSASRAVTAMFDAALGPYTLTVQKSGTGSGTVSGGAIECGATCSASLAADTAVTLTATAAAGSTFVGWSGCDTATGLTCHVTMTASKTVTATFNPVLYTLTVQKSGTGTGTVSGGAISCGATCSATLASGTAVTLSATADAGSIFSSWTGCGSFSGATCNVTMDANRTVAAAFSPEPGGLVGSLAVTNGTSYTIAQLFVSPAGADDWGADLLVTSVAPGGSFTLTDIPVGTYDFRAVADDGYSYWQRNAAAITAGGPATWTLQPPSVGSLTLVNNHCIAVDQLYVKPASAMDWSLNQLAVPVAPAGGTFTLTSLPVGSYDVNAVAPDGTNWTTYRISITAGGTFTWPLFMPAGTGCVTVVNNIGATIDFLFAPPSPTGCTGNVWGNDLLQGVKILPNTSYTVSKIPQGARDLRALDLAMATSYYYCAASIVSGGTLQWPLQMP